MTKTQKESVITVFNKENQLVAIVYKDMETRHNLVYKVELMDFEEMAGLLDDETKINEES